MNEWEHMILPSADALRADLLSGYGFHRETTPVWTDLAAESIRFTDAYSASAHTQEAVSALLTGKNSDITVDEDYGLATELVAATLVEEGFATGDFHSNPFISWVYGFNRGFDVFDDLHLGPNKFIATTQGELDEFRDRHYARAAVLNGRSLKWIDSLDEGQPFLLWNHYTDTHGPYKPLAEYARGFDKSAVADGDAQSLYQRVLADPDLLADVEHEQLIGLYVAEIRHDNAQVEGFLGALRERDLLEDSPLVVTADHGDAFGEHGRYGHPYPLHESAFSLRETHAHATVSAPAQRSRRGGVNVSQHTRHLGDGRGRTGYGTSLGAVSMLDPSVGERLMFQQARKEADDAHRRRYAVRTEAECCFYERDRRTDAVEFDGTTDRSLRSTLGSHAQRRVQCENGEPGKASAATGDEVERRLNMLGHKV